MSHHLSTSLSASAASALHVLGGRLRSFAPSPRVVLGVAALTAAGVLGIAGGGSNAQIGRELFMSEATVKAHVSKIFAKLDCTNRVQIAIIAHEAGLTDIDHAPA